MALVEFACFNKRPQGFRVGDPHSMTLTLRVSN